MEKKPCPIDRGKLLIGLECCREYNLDYCLRCQYIELGSTCFSHAAKDALAYICYLEELLNAKADNPN